MVVNPPSSGNTLDAYKTAAKGVQSAMSPATGVSGGVVMANSDGGASSNSSSMSSGSGSATKTGSTSSASASASASAASTGAASGLVRPFTGAAAIGMLALGLGVWTSL